MEKETEKIIEQIPSPDDPLDKQARYFDAHPEDIRSEYLNNFFLLLPYSDNIKTLERHGAKFLDMPHTQESLHSNLWNSQTPRQFYAGVKQELKNLLTNEAQQKIYDLEIQRASIQQEIEDNEKVFRSKGEGLSEMIEKDRDKDHLVYQQKIDKINQVVDLINNELVPLYLALRRKGYNHYDITS